MLEKFNHLRREMGKHLLQATRREYQKMGKHLSDAELKRTQEETDSVGASEKS